MNKQEYKKPEILDLNVGNTQSARLKTPGTAEAGLGGDNMYDSAKRS